MNNLLWGVFLTMMSIGCSQTVQVPVMDDATVQVLRDASSSDTAALSSDGGELSMVQADRFSSMEPPYRLSISFTTPREEEGVQAIRLRSFVDTGTEALVSFEADFVPAAPRRINSEYELVRANLTIQNTFAFLNVAWREGTSEQVLYEFSEDRRSRFLGSVAVRDQYGRTWLGFPTDLAVSATGSPFTLPRGYLFFLPADQCLPPYRAERGYLCLRE